MPSINEPLVVAQFFDLLVDPVNVVSDALWACLGPGRIRRRGHPDRHRNVVVQSASGLPSSTGAHDRQSPAPGETMMSRTSSWMIVWAIRNAARGISRRRAAMPGVGVGSVDRIGGVEVRSQRTTSMPATSDSEASKSGSVGWSWRRAFEPNCDRHRSSTNGRAAGALVSTRNNWHQGWRTAGGLPGTAPFDLAQARTRCVAEWSSSDQSSLSASMSGTCGRSSDSDVYRRAPASDRVHVL